MIACCTIVTKSYIPYARVLADSIRRHTPGCKLFVLLADRLQGEFDPGDEPFELIRLEQLGDERRIERMAFSYSPYEFCCGLRGHLHEYLMAETDLDRWLFMDADVCTYASLAPVFDELDDQSLLLCPHQLSPRGNPLGVPARMTDARYLMRGIYNGGLLGLRRSPETERFIAWFKNRLIAGAVHEGELAWDQGWLVLAAGLFTGVTMLHHPGVNVAVWNHHERELHRDRDGQPRAGQHPLVMAHFSDLTCAPLLLNGKVSAERLLADCRKGTDVSFTVLCELAVEYVRALREQGFERFAGGEWAFARLPDGTSVPGGIKRLFRILCRSGWSPADPPFDPASWRTIPPVKPHVAATPSHP